MDIISTILDFWWVLLFVIPLYLLYLRSKQGKGIGSFGLEETKLILFFCFVLLILFLCQKYLFTDHLYLLFFMVVFTPIFMAFIYILLMKDNVFIIESTMDCEIFYDIGQLDKKIAESTRTRAFMIDREAYRDIRHVGEIDYQFWNGGDGVKFTDYFDQREGVMYHPAVGALHNVSFFVAKSFWLRMKQDIPEVIRQNILLTWLKDYQVVFNQKTLAKNFEFRLRNISRQIEDEPFNFPDDYKKLYEREVEAHRRDKELQETKEPIQSDENPVAPVAAEGGGDK